MWGQQTLSWLLTELIADGSCVSSHFAYVRQLSSDIINLIFDYLQPMDTCAPDIRLRLSKIIYVRVRESKSNVVGFTVVPYEAH